MKIETWSTERLSPYARELKKHEKALPKMVAALQQWGFRIPILVSSAGEIIDGKLRYLAAVQLGMQEIPVVVADDLTPTQIRTFACSSTVAPRGLTGMMSPCASRWPSFALLWQISA